MKWRPCEGACAELEDVLLWVRLPRPSIAHPFSSSTHPMRTHAHAATAAEPMAHILAAGQRFPPSLRENAAIALGRLAMMAPDALAPHWGHFCTPWCTVSCQGQGKRRRRCLQALLGKAAGRLGVGRGALEMPPVCGLDHLHLR